MQFLALTYGTEGDTRPLAALCRALVDRGHGVRLLADASTLALPRSLGLEVAALPGDIRGLIGRDGGIAEINRTLAALVAAQSTAWLREAVEAGAGCDAVIVSGLTAFVGLSAAEALGVPAIGTLLIPITPTRAFGSPFLPPGLPRWLNEPGHRFVNALIWRRFRRPTNEARAAVGLAPRREAWHDHPMLYGVSPTLVPQPADWPANARVCGQWIPPSAGWTPPAALVDYLAAGEPPVYVGFGSMGGFDRNRITAALVGALGDRRVLFNPGWSGIEPTTLPGNFEPIGAVPHDWLFPKMATVIHHGGSGTTHSAARAGVPSIAVPFAGDQPFWARRLVDAGLAVEQTSGQRLTAALLGRALEFAGRASTRARARDVGERIRAEDGLAVALPRIEDIVADRGRQSMTGRGRPDRHAGSGRQA